VTGVTAPGSGAGSEKSEKSHIGRLARRVRDSARHTFHSVQLRQGLSALERTLQAGRQPKVGLLERLVHGWGNEAWGASSLFLGAMLEWLPRTSDSIVECGSGLSTLLLAAAALLVDRPVHSLEHEEKWATLVMRRLPERWKTAVSVRTTPLRSYGEFDWYAFDPAILSVPIGFVVCDGPPASTRGGRYGLAPILGNRFEPGCIIMLDDTQRREERAIVNRWCRELGAAVVQEGGTFTVLRVGTSRRPI